MRKINVYENRPRYAVVTPDGQILCGVKGHYHFAPIDNLGRAHIKTYQSREQAEGAAFWHADTFKIVELQEVLYEVL